MSTFRARIIRPGQDATTYTLRATNSGKARQEAETLALTGERVELDIYSLHKSEWRPFLVRGDGTSEWQNV